MKTIFRFIRSFHKRSPRYLYLYTITVLLASFAELLSLVVFYPLIDILLSGDLSIAANNILNKVFFNAWILNVVTENIVLVFLVLIIIVCILRLALVFVQASYSQKIGRQINIDYVDANISQSFLNSKGDRANRFLVSVTEYSEIAIARGLVPFFNALSAIILCFFIFIALMLLAPWLTLIFVSIFGTVTLVMVAFFKRRLTVIGQLLEVHKEAKVRVAHAIVSNRRDIIINEQRNLYREEFETSESAVRTATTQLEVLGQAPQVLLESLGLLFLIGITFLFQSAAGATVVLAEIGALALGMQKMLPLAHRIYLGWSNVKSADAIMSSLNNYLTSHDHSKVRSEQEPDSNSDADRFEEIESISLKDVDFQYPGSDRPIFSRASLKFNNSSWIALVGSSGSGKTTLLDLLMGIIEPDKGDVVLNDTRLTSKNLKPWYRKISYVPQEVFIFSGTILDNLRVNNRGLSEERARVLLNLVNLGDFADRINDSELLGDYGSRLSGGQARRLAIARALSKNFSVLVLDEFTNGLDLVTEGRVISNIKREFPHALTIVVSHKASTVEQCARVIDVSNLGRERVHETKR